MSKEWLEDKKKQLNNATIFINENGNEAVEVSLSVLNKLIEQAERVQGLKIVLEILGEQNKRYREALEEIMRTETVTTALAEGQVAYTFSGHIARQALEGEK